uniref:Uncharacterized protein n=1 Tax=Anguilla anguilla TaxID=7936 RepID=A0A0E9QVY3_ANGAN
MNVKQVAGLRY